jgi:hypothetical protein
VAQADSSSAISHSKWLVLTAAGSDPQT